MEDSGALRQIAGGRDGGYTLTVEVEDNARECPRVTPLIMTVDTQTSITDITLVNDHGVPDDNPG